MENRELDALMWKMLNDKKVTLFDCRYVDGDVQPHAGYPIGHISPEPYSTDIAAAWKVLLKLEAKSPTVTIRVSNGDGDSCDVDILGDMSSKLKSVHLSIEGGLEQAPRAICLAALKAVGYEGVE